MKRLLLLLLALALGASAHAQSLSGEIAAIDAAAGSISVSAGAAEPKVYRVRPSVEVLLNGARAKFADLALGMTVRLTSGEPGLATRIEAQGSATAAKDKEGLAARLIGTTWLWHESKEQREAITFKANGTASSDARPRPFKWEAAAGNRVEGVTPWGKKFRIIFDATFTHGRLAEGDEKTRDTKLVTK